jgi:hypothetical protein
MEVENIKNNIDIKPYGYWNNLDNIKKEAMDCCDSGELRKKNGAAATAMYRNGWVDLIFPKKNTKKCRACRETKPISDFSKVKYKYNGDERFCYRKECKLCRSISNSRKTKQEYLNDLRFKEEREELYKIGKRRCTKCKEIKVWDDFPNDSRGTVWKGKKGHCKVCAEKMRKRYMRTPAGKKMKSISDKKYAQKNKESINNNFYRKLDEDPLFKLTHSIRSLIGHAIRNGGYTKKSKTHEILGCSYEDFKHHIESQFKPWMSWDNYGKWELDHIIPVSSKNDEDELIKLNHHTNIQPMEASKNRIKNASYLEEDKQRFLDSLK